MNNSPPPPPPKKKRGFGGCSMDRIGAVFFCFSTSYDFGIHDYVQWYGEGKVEVKYRLNFCCFKITSVG